MTISYIYLSILKKVWKTLQKLNSSEDIVIKNIVNVQNVVKTLYETLQTFKLLKWHSYHFFLGNVSPGCFDDLCL